MYRNARIMAGLISACIVLAACGENDPAPSISPEATSQGCTESGGTVASQPCCSGTPDFPNTCLVGACGCSAESSTAHSVCVCPADTCFDGTACVSVPAAVAIREKGCTDSGGVVASGECCTGTAEFPNTCLIGACGCSAENSTTHSTCVCPAGTCFDETACVTVTSLPSAKH